MNSRIKILFLIIIELFSMVGNAQDLNNQNRLFLFTDRDYCISGDTVWFKVWLPEALKQKGNVVRVQLDNQEDHLITSVVKKSKNGWAEGFLFIPDSLSSDLYFITAFLNAQREVSTLELYSQSLFVYNRFEESVSEIEILESESINESKTINSPIEIYLNKTEYNTREKVLVHVNFVSLDTVSNAIVKAAIVDPLAKEIGGLYKFSLVSLNKSIPVFAENDGLLLSGKVVDAENTPQKSILVVLSIAGEPPYFDYCISGDEGEFNFFLKNAVGKANIVLQTVSDTDKEYFIQKGVNCLKRKDKIPSQVKVLTSQQTHFITTSISGNFINKLFNPRFFTETEGFDMPIKFSVPFYGPPSLRVVPAEFIDLPDFREISRELLPGVQYRVNNDKIVFRMLNESRGIFFDNEPLRLLNGIPVFKNKLFSELKSTDINYIDIVQKERLFGDLMFKGILAVSTKDTLNNWMARQPNIFQFYINCLQPDKTPGYLIQKKTGPNQPDVRQTFLWEVVQPGATRNFEFVLSDIKGNVEISIEGLTTNNKIFKASKIIEVK